MADVAAEGKTVQLMLSPVNLPPGKGAWSFRLPQSTAVMAIPIVEHWKKTGVKTFGFLGYSDAYGEAWLSDIKPLGREGRHQAGRHRALRAHRHQRHRPGAQAHRRPTRTRS